MSRFATRTRLMRMYGPAGVTNIVSGKQFVSSAGSDGGFGVEHLTDGNLNTRWISQVQSPATLTVDLGGVYNISLARITWAANTTKDYVIETSMNGADWTSQANGTTDGTASTQTLEHPFTATARYVRIRMQTMHNTTFGNSIWEIEIMGERNTGYASGFIYEFKATKSSDSLVELTWQYSGDPLTSFTIERDNTVIATITDTSQRSYQDSSVALGSTYRYTITGQFQSGGETNTAADTVTLIDTSGLFQVVGKDIIGPNGQPFIPIGINFGTNGFCCGDPSGGNKPARFPDGHSGDCAAWNWNTVRLCFVVSDKVWGYRQIGHSYGQLFDYTTSLVDEYLAAGFVVWPEAHDFTLRPGASVGSSQYNQCRQWWLDLANRYKDNPYVWFNLFNEPVWRDSQKWVDIHDNLIGEIRAIAPNNVIVLDVINAGQDGGWSGAKFTYEASQGVYLNEKYGNLVFAQHNYSAYQDKASLETYYQNMWNAGLCIVHGEIGYTTNGSATAATYAENVAAGNAVFENALANDVGVLWWNGNHGDYYQLTNSGNSDPFWTSSPGTNLSDAGAKMWGLSH